MPSQTKANLVRHRPTSNDRHLHTRTLLRKLLQLLQFLFGKEACAKCFISPGSPQRDGAAPARIPCRAHTLCLGGGTPSVLGIEGIGEITGSVREIIEQCHATAGTPAPADFREVTAE